MTTSGFVAAVPGVVEATRDADLIIHHQIDVPAFGAALVHRRARVTGAMFPTLLPGGLEAWIARLVTPWLSDVSYNRILAAAGLPERRRILLEVSESPLLNLLAVSPTLIPPRPTWDQRWVMTGFGFSKRRVLRLMLRYVLSLNPVIRRSSSRSDRWPEQIRLASWRAFATPSRVRAVGSSCKQACHRSVSASGWSPCCASTTCRMTGSCRVPRALCITAEPGRAPQPSVPAFPRPSSGTWVISRRGQVALQTRRRGGTLAADALEFPCTGELLRTACIRRGHS